MNCPRCKNIPLKKGELKSKQLELEQCPKCKGMWFDKDELAVLLGPRAEKDFSIPKHAIQNFNTLCPKCNISLNEFCYPGTLTLVDSCQQCQGIWLDYGEWKTINQARDESNKITCPKCNTRQVPADSCNQCGIIFAKYQKDGTSSIQKKSSSRQSNSYGHRYNDRGYADNIPGLKGTLLRAIDSAIRSLSSGIGFGK